MFLVLDVIELDIYTSPEQSDIGARVDCDDGCSPIVSSPQSLIKSFRVYRPFLDSEPNLYVEYYSTIYEGLVYIFRSECEMLLLLSIFGYIFVQVVVDNTAMGKKNNQ